MYELTERGHALKPAILELARWGRPLLLDPAKDRLPDSALLLGLEVAFQPDAAAGLDETYDLEVDGNRVAVRVHHGTVDITPPSGSSPTGRALSTWPAATPPTACGSRATPTRSTGCNESSPSPDRVSLGGEVPAGQVLSGRLGHADDLTRAARRPDQLDVCPPRRLELVSWHRVVGAGG